MANGRGKLSQQVAASQPQARPTRTQRRLVVSEKRREREQFERLKQRAIETQQQKFSNIQSIEQYEQEYGALDPQLQPFFETPTQLRSEKAERITTNISKVEERISYARGRLQEEEKKYREDIEWARNKNWGSNGSQKRRDYINRRDEEYDEKSAYWQGYIKGLGKGKEQLLRNKDIDYGTIESYASDLGRYEEDRREAKKQNRKQQKKIEDAIKEAQGGGSFVRIRESFKGSGQGEKIYAVSPSGQYTLISESKPSVSVNSKTIKPSTLGSIPITQKYKIGDLQLNFKGTEKLYTTDKGDLVTPYGSLGVTESKILETQRIEAEKREAQASQYLSEKGFFGQIEAKAEKKQNVLSKSADYLKAIYGASLFGTGLKMPDEYLEARKPVSVSGSPIGIGLPIGISFYSLDFGKSLEGVRAERQKRLEGEKQIELITGLDKLTEKAPEEIQYEVQQKGLKLLERRGIRTELDEATQLIKVTSDQFQQSKSYNFYEFEKARAKEEKALGEGKPYVLSFTSPERKEQIYLPFQRKGTATFDVKTGNFEANKTEITIPAKTTTVSPYTVAVGTRIAVTKAAEFSLVGKGLGAVFGGVAKGAKGIYSGLGGGYRISEAIVRGGSASATLTPTLTSKILAGKTGTILKVAGTGALYAGGGTLFVAGKIKQGRSYREAYGDLGADVFKYETIGEVAGISALVGEGLYKGAQARQAQREATFKNYERMIKVERIKNIQRYGQYSPLAEATYKGAGIGTKLTKRETSELARIYSEATGLSRSRASKAIQESAVFKSSLKVRSPTGLKPYETSKISVLTAEKTRRGTQELAIEFTRRGGVSRNLVLKATTGKGKYAVTSVFEKARVRPSQLTEEFILQKTIASKIAKTRSLKVGEVTLRSFDVEQRLMKSYPYGRERFAIKDILELGSPKYKQADLARIYMRAGESAATTRALSPFKPARTFTNIRIEAPKYRDVGGGIKVANILREYQFAQAGKGGRQIALKNVLKDIDFKNLERALQGTRTKTPISKTFATDVGAEQDVRQIALKNVLRATKGEKTIGTSIATQTRPTSAYAGTGLYERTGEVAVKIPTTVGDVAISPSVQSDLKIRVTERILTKVGLDVGIKTAGAFALGTAGFLGLKQQNQLKSELRAKQLLRELTGEKTIQRTNQKQPQPLRQLQIPASTFSTPRTPIIDIPTTPSPSRTPSTRPTPPFGARTNINELLKKLLRRKGEKGTDVYYLIPDFASKAIGISPEYVGSEKDALKAISRVQTGLELRRGIRVRRSKNNRSLTKGIMN